MSWNAFYKYVDYQYGSKVKGECERIVAEFGEGCDTTAVLGKALSLQEGHELKRSSKLNHMPFSSGVGFPEVVSSDD